MTKRRQRHPPTARSADRTAERSAKRTAARTAARPAAGSDGPLERLSARLAPWLPWLLAGVAVAVFLPVVRFQFLHWDDHSLVWRNPHYQPATLDGLVQLWRSDYLGFYIPATYTVWWLQALVLGMDGNRFHAVNLLVHTANVVLVYAIARRLLEARRAPAAALLAACGALLFAVHPLRVETVAWVTAMKDLLSTFFALLAVFVYFRPAGPRLGPARHVPPGTLWYVLALLAKPALVTLPLVVMVLDVALRGTAWRAAVRGAWLWLLMAVPFALLTRYAQPTSMIVSIPPLWFRPFIAADALHFYLVKLVAPLDLAPVYARTPAWLQESGAWRWTWMTPAALAAAAGWLAWRRRQLVPLGLLAAFVLALAPVLGIIPYLGYNLSVVADHYLYFPSLLVSLAVSLALAEARPRARTAGLALVPAAAAVLAALTMAYLPTWRDDATLLPHAVERAPRTSLLRMNYGEYLYSAGDYEASLAQFRAAAEILPHPDIYNNIGAALVALRRYEEARTAFEQSLAMNPADEEVQENLANLDRYLGR